MGPARCVGAMCVALLAATGSAAAQEVQHHRVALDDFRTSSFWPWRGEVDPWPGPDGEPLELPASRKTPHAALYLTPGYRFILTDFSLTGGPREPLDAKRGAPIYLASQIAEDRGFAHAARAVLQLGGSDGERDEARSQLLASGRSGMLLVAILRTPLLWTKLRTTLAKGFDRQPRIDGVSAVANAGLQRAARAAPLVLCNIDNRKLASLQGELASLWSEMETLKAHRFHLPALVKALSPGKGKRRRVALCLVADAVSTRAALDIRDALKGFNIAYGFLGDWDAPERRMVSASAIDVESRPGAVAVGAGNSR